MEGRGGSQRTLRWRSECDVWHRVRRASGWAGLQEDGRAAEAEHAAAAEGCVLRTLCFVHVATRSRAEAGLFDGVWATLDFAPHSMAQAVERAKVEWGLGSHM